jgi:hypothetical protein
VSGERGLDHEEEALFAAAREGVSRASEDGSAVADIRWDDFEEPTGVWPQYVLRDARGAAPGVAVWFWPNDRRRGNSVVAALCLGDPATGIVCELHGLTLDGLSDAVSKTVEAVIEGRATYLPRLADPENYQDEIEDGALSVLLKASSAHGDWAISARGYLANPTRFRAATGVPIDEQIGETHPLPAFSA